MFVGADARMRLALDRLIRRISQRQVLSRVAGNIAWLALDKSLKLGLILLVTAWLARYLGPEDFGRYNYVIAFVALFAGMATLGLPTIVVRELVREPEARGEILGTSALLLMLGGLVALGFAALISTGARPGDHVARTGVIIVAAALVFQSGAVVRYWFESQVAARHLIVPENLALVIGAAARILLILSEAPLLAFFWVQLAEAILVCTFLPAAYSRLVGDLRRWRITLRRARQLMHDAWPFAVTGGIAMIQARLDQVVLSRLAGDHALGYYSVALRVSESLVFFSAALQSSTFPILVEARRKSVELFRDKLELFYRVMFLAAYLICVPVALFGPWIVHSLFGPAYDPAGVLLSLMSGRIFLAFMGLARSVYLAIENMQRYATITVAVGTVLNLVLNLWWIPDYEAVGAVWASLVSFTVTTVLVDLLFPSVRRNALDILRAMITPHRIVTP